MKLSILMPVYNEESTLGSIVDRVLAVEYPCDMELILVDDGTTIPAIGAKVLRSGRPPGSHRAST